MKTDRRFLRSCELRVEDKDGAKPVIRGYAAIFDTPSLVLANRKCPAFREFVRPGAFDGAIEGKDIRALIDHEDRLVVGRTTAGTLRLYEDTRGLAIEIDPPDTSYGRDLMESLRRGDIDQMSFGFGDTPTKVDDIWSTPDAEGIRTRQLIKVKDLQEVSIVTWGAYPDTEVEAAIRSLNRHIENESHPILENAKRIWKLATID